MNTRLALRRIAKVGLLVAIALALLAIYLVKSAAIADIQHYIMRSIASTYASGAFAVLLVIALAYLVFIFRKK